MIKFGNTTHFPRSAIVRLSLKVFVYCFLCIGSFLPLLIYSFRNSHSAKQALAQGQQVACERIMFDNLDSQYSEDDLPDSGTPSPPTDTTFASNFMIPSFIPALLGLGFFAMYGVSSHAIQIYKKAYFFVRSYFPCFSDGDEKSSSQKKGNCAYATEKTEEGKEDSASNVYTLHTLPAPAALISMSTPSLIEGNQFSPVACTEAGDIELGIKCDRKSSVVYELLVTSLEEVDLD